MKINIYDGSLVSNRSAMNRSFRHFVVGFGYFLFVVLAIFIIAWFSSQNPLKKFPIVLDKNGLTHLSSETVVLNAEGLSLPSVKNCTYYSCYDIYSCSHNAQGKISVYIYPLTEFVDEEVNIFIIKNNFFS